MAVEVTPAKERFSGRVSDPGPDQLRREQGRGETDGEPDGDLQARCRDAHGILSLEAIAGKPANFSLFVKNTGSAVNRNITFSSFKPENWEITFKPEKIDALEPGEMKQVEVTIKPGAQSLVGDYSVGVMVNGEKSDKTVEMRVTVKASTAWGWIGIGLILFVIAGLSALFIRMGRR